MQLSKKEVEHIATLARLNLTEEEKEKYSRQLSDILNYMEKMKGVDTSKVESTSQVTGLTNVMRKDKIEECGVAEQVIDCAPETKDGYVKVPKILENK